MGAKTIVQNFYKSDVLLEPEKVNALLHPDVILEWHSSKGFLKLHKDQIIELSHELGKAYLRSKSRISHIVSDGNTVSVRYSHFVKTIENPREEMLLAHFMVIWEVKDDKLYRGYQMSQL
ncbi:nuclear transport factor 2 family protein [Flavobacterium sedimenticola]|uniref:Nuclear transport factor 2 family protein n=1 Tax=Flavobacterium sedimenticola TaxID=3043286 RepID=A0ABT6XTC2_9FLAO|nr:nuclear transport factor 2 family protein [Flavobacterium sedimenticola]MDI9258355.1 nuclear transport factor 2 family protein [Flavobacterium sedimenticola]